MVSERPNLAKGISVMPVKVEEHWQTRAWIRTRAWKFPVEPLQGKCFPDSRTGPQPLARLPVAEPAQSIEPLQRQQALTRPLVLRPRERQTHSPQLLAFLQPASRGSFAAFPVSADAAQVSW